MRSFLTTAGISVVVLWLFASEGLAQDSKDCPLPEGSTAFESCVLQKKTAAEESKLRGLIKERLKNKEAAGELRKSQAAWKRFRDVTCQWQQTEYGGINSISAVRCFAQLTAERVSYFEGLP